MSVAYPILSEIVGIAGVALAVAGTVGCWVFAGSSRDKAERCAAMVVLGVSLTVIAYLISDPAAARRIVAQVATAGISLLVAALKWSRRGNRRH